MAHRNLSKMAISGHKTGSKNGMIYDTDSSFELGFVGERMKKGAVAKPHRFVAAPSCNNCVVAKPQKEIGLNRIISAGMIPSASKSGDNRLACAFPQAKCLSKGRNNPESL